LRVSFLTLILIIAGIQVNVQAQEYLWPTDSGTYLSATFGETRSAHFHAGLDIKTWGREGYRVFAARDGILYRLLVTERGYGNAIYLKHSDNTFTTYAHLQRFNSEFQQLADSIRMQDHSFEMDSNFEVLAIPVNKGDVIGYTGSTGIGPPHLHFEIRDSLDKPINALHANFSIKDSLPPVFSSLIVEPITDKSRINHKPVSYFKRPQMIDDDYHFGTVEINGKAGLAVNVFDKADDVYNAYAIHQLTLIQGTDTLFHEVLDSFYFDQEEEMFLDRIAPFGSHKRGHQRLYGKDGHNNPFYLVDKNEARIEAPAKPTSYTIVAQDFFGNTSTAKLTVSHNSTLQKISKSVAWLNFDDWYWHENWFTPDHINTFTFEDLEGISISQDHKLVSKEDENIEFLRLRPDSTYKIDSQDRSLRLRFRPHTFFDTLMIATTRSITVDSSTIISVLPGNAPLKQDFMIEYFLGDDFKQGVKYGLYRIDPEDGDLNNIDSRIRGKTILGFPNEFGSFKLLADDQKPVLYDPRLVKSDYGKWFVYVDANDALSGIDSSSAIFTVNGVRGIAEYDYEEELLRYYHPNFVPEKTNTIQLSVMDKAGNVVELSDTLTLPGL